VSDAALRVAPRQSNLGHEEPDVSRRLGASGLLPRCELVVGDLLESVPTGADRYLMRCLLHGYDDASCRRILRNVRRAMEPESRVLLIEEVLPNQVDRADPEVEKLIMSDLNMLAVTGGRERSEKEWAALLRSAGLELHSVSPVAGQSYCILEAGRGRPAEGASSGTPSHEVASCSTSSGVIMRR